MYMVIPKVYMYLIRSVVELSSSSLNYLISESNDVCKHIFSTCKVHSTSLFSVFNVML